MRYAREQTKPDYKCAWIFLCSASVGAPGSVPGQVGLGFDLVNDILVHGRDVGTR